MKRELIHILDSRTQGALCLAVVLPLLQWGCASQPRSFAYVSLPGPPPEEVREQVTVIRIVGTELKETQVEQPMGKGKAAGQGALTGFAAAPMAGVTSGNPYGVVAGLFLAPLTGTAGAIYGAFAGMTKEEYQRICTTLRAAARETEARARFELGVTEAIRELTPAISIAATNASAGSERTLLEITPTVAGLRGPSGINPPLTLVCVVRVRLVRVNDGAELYGGEFTHHGMTHSLRQWADDGGASFRQGIMAVCRELPTHIVERVFLYHPLPPSLAQSRILPWNTEP